MTDFPNRVGTTAAQIVGVDTQGITKLTVGASSNHAALPNAKSVVIVANADCFIALGGSGVTASDANLPLFERQPIVLRIRPGQTHLAAQGSSGNVWVVPVGID